jgi:hypothetical protein
MEFKSQREMVRSVILGTFDEAVKGETDSIFDSDCWYSIFLTIFEDTPCGTVEDPEGHKDKRWDQLLHEWDGLKAASEWRDEFEQKVTRAA